MQRRPGRPRKQGQGYPNGQLIRRRDGFSSPVITQRLRVRYFEDDDINPISLSEIVRLDDAKKLGELEAVAALCIGQIYGWHDFVKRQKRRLYSPSYSMGYLQVQQLTPQQVKDFEQEAITKFNDLQQEMLELPTQVRNAVEELCVENKFP